jgi:DeoR family myo-inositol catabolism operon transcriptional repressor
MEQYVLDKGTASLDELCDTFAISINTVRRDLSDLLTRGRIKKVYGGVSATAQPAPVIPTSERAARNIQAKQLIGQMAAQLVKDGMSIFLDSGSTTMCLLPHLAEKTNVTVITHSLAALYEAAKYPSLHIIALGGLYNDATSSFFGSSTLNELSKMTIDIVFVAATGVSLRYGLTNTTYFEVEIKRSVARRNQNIVLMADHSKFDHNALLSFCSFEALSAVVTDEPLPGEYADLMALHNIRLIAPQNGAVK